MIMENAQNKLIRWAQAQIGKEYRWGEVDCVTLTLQGLRIMHGDKLFRDLDPWDSKEMAMRVYIKYNTAEDFLSRHGWKPVHQNYARTGDVLILKTLPVQTVTIVVNNKCLIIDPEKGVQLSPISTRSEYMICYQRPGFPSIAPNEECSCPALAGAQGVEIDTTGRAN